MFIFEPGDINISLKDEETFNNVKEVQKLHYKTFMAIMILGETRESLQAAIKDEYTDILKHLEQFDSTKQTDLQQLLDFL